MVDAETTTPAPGAGVVACGLAGWPQSSATTVAFNVKAPDALSPEP